MTPYMYFPIANVTRDGKSMPAKLKGAGADGFEGSARRVFLQCDNEGDQVIESSVQISWSKTPPSNSDAFKAKIELNPDYLDAIREGGPKTRFYGSVSSWRINISRNAGKGTRLLARVTASDVLYIVGHGNFAGGFIMHVENLTDEDHYEVYSLRVDMLANMLVAEGLPTSHVWLKVNSCWAGGANGSQKTFSHDLAIELGKRGYRNILVGGYQFPVCHGYEHNHYGSALQAIVRIGDGQPTIKTIPGTFFPDAYSAKKNPNSRILMFEADALRCWYDAKGQQVRWNAPDLPDDWREVPLLSRNDTNWLKWARRDWEEYQWIEKLKEKGLM